MPETEELRIYLRTVADTTGAKQTQTALRGIQTQVVSVAATGTGVYAALRAVDAFVTFLGDSITALREHQRTMLETSAAYATMATSMTNLDAAFARAEKTGNEFQIMIGRIAAPAVLSGIKGIGGAIEGTTNLLKDASKAAFELSKNPFFQGVMAAGGVGLGGTVGPAITQLAAAGQQLETEERAAARRRQELQMRRLREINELPATTMAQEAGRLAFWDQVDAAVREAVQAQERQVDLQRESVNLAAQEAQMRLALLPAQARILELQRQITEQQIRAQQAALPATEALEDLRYLQRRAELISRNRNVAVEERIAARRQLRGIGRAEPGVELRAIEAERGVTIAGRAATRFGLEQQLFEISTQRQLAQIEQAVVTNQLLSVIAAQGTQAIALTINLSTEEFQKEVYKQLIEANNQAQGPTVVKLSGTRR